MKLLNHNLLFPCFKDGVGREMVADDVLYSWRRLADPKYTYKNWWLVDQQIKGFDDYKETQKKRVDKGEAFDYSAEVEGLKKIDDHHFQVVFNRAVQQFSWKLAMFQLSVVPREAVETYGTAFASHPVGTGPFRLESESDWVRKSRMRLVRNPKYHHDVFPAELGGGDGEQLYGDYVGTKLPIVDEIQFSFFVQSTPMWLEFKAKSMDFSTVPEEGFKEYFKQSDKSLKATHRIRGIQSVSLPLLDFIFRGFNMEDELVGGLEPKKKALRQAICLAIDLDEMNRDRYNGECVIFDGPIPAGLDGHPAGGRAPASYRGPDLEAARAKLVEAGYTIGDDGKVTDLPPIGFYTSSGAESEKIVELMARSLERVGIRINPNFLDFSELIAAINNKKAPFFSFAWGSDYPDAENNLALFYGPNESPGSNHFNYKRPEYDALYESILEMPPGPARTKIYEQMRDMVIEDAPFAGSMGRTRRYLIYPWLKNFKPTETFYNYIKYWDVDVEAREKAKKR